MEKYLTEEDFKNIDEFTVLYKELCENKKINFNNEVYYSAEELSKAFSKIKPLSNKNLKTWAHNIYLFFLFLSGFWGHIQGVAAEDSCHVAFSYVFF